MPGLSRRTVLAAACATVATTEWVTSADGTADESNTGRGRKPARPLRTGTTASGGETTRETETTTDWIAHALNTPEPDHSVLVSNATASPRLVRVRVVRQRTGETVFRSVREIPAETEASVYNLAQAGPDGIESFRICARLVGLTTGTTETTSATATGTARTRTSVESSGTVTRESTDTTATTARGTTARGTVTRGTVTRGTTTSGPSDRGCLSIETSACYGDVYVGVDDEDSLWMTYAIC